MKIIISPYNLESDLKTGTEFVKNPKKFAKEYGFYYSEQSEYKYVHTTGYLLSFGGHLFIGTFCFKKDCLKNIELLPVFTERVPNYPNVEYEAEKKRICDEVIESVGRNIGQYSLQSYIGGGKANGTGGNIHITKHK